VRPGAALVVGTIVVAGGCSPAETGVHLHARLGQLQYDELRFHIARTASADVTGGVVAETIVDPLTTGRYVGPFRPGDQDVIVFLADDLAGSRLVCEATAFHMGVVAGRGSGDVVVERQKIKNVDIFMASADAAMPGRASGEACSIGAECITGRCTDGVCCESDCQMACHSCALETTRGLCRPVPEGTSDIRGKCTDKGAASCQTNGLCGVAGTCAVHPAGTICEPARCVDHDTAVEPARTCNGSGKCDASDSEGKGDGKVMCPDPSMCVSGACS
jgi:hypothetical protein